MIDAEGQELHKVMMDLICPKDNVLTEAQKTLWPRLMGI
jgi:hypothetical protein